MNQEVIKIMVTDFPCTCGHKYSKHCASKYPYRYMIGSDNECYGRDSTSLGLICLCLNYFSDNLKYLEQKYEALQK